MKTKTVKRQAMILGTAAVLLTSALSPSLNLFFTQKLEAATTSTAPLVPGDNHIAGSTTYGTSDLSVHSNWELYQAATATRNYLPVWRTDLPGTWLQMNDDSGSGEATYAVLQYALDMTQPVNFTGTLKSNSGIVGDSLGIIFSPVSATNIRSGLGGSYLGIGKLPNTVYIGRDFYYNGDGDFKSGYLAGSNIDNSAGFYYNPLPIAFGSTQFRIETTNSSGAMTPSGTSWNLPNPISTAAINSTGNPYGFSWSPTTVNADGTVTGNLMFYIDSTATRVEYNNYVMQPKMSMALSASGLGNYGAKFFSFNGGSFNATKATNTVAVNYINSRTGKSIATPSTIKGNIGDIIGVISPTATTFNDSNTYDYNAPNLVSSDYIYSSSSPVTIENGSVNTINVNYIPVTETANFKAYYASGTPGTSASTTVGGFSLSTPSLTPQILGTAAALPSIASTTGYYGEVASSPTYTTPSGYGLDKVIGPDGKSYATVSDALSSNLLQITPSGGSNSNDFTIVLKANAQSAATHFNFTGIPSGVTVPTVADSNFLEGMTGQPITSQNIQSIIDQYNLFISSNKDWKITSLTFPDGTISNLSNIDDITNLILSNMNNIYLKPRTNLFTLNLTYIGQITIQGEDILFGTVKVSGTGQLNSAPFPDNVIVNDTRPNPVNWKLSIEQKIPIHPVGKDISVKDKNNIIYFGTSVSSNTPLSNTDGTPNLVDVFTNLSPRQELTNVSTSLSGKYKFYLYMPPENQKVGDFESTVEWVLSNVP